MPIYGLRTCDRWARRIGMAVLVSVAAISLIAITLALAVWLVFLISLLVQ